MNRWTDRYMIHYKTIHSDIERHGILTCNEQYQVQLMS